MTAQVEASQKLYASLASTYDDETRFISGVRKLAIDALNLPPGETVLDAGCGTGWCLPMLAQRVGPKGQVIGFEPSPDMLALAQSRVDRCGLTNTRLLRYLFNGTLD